MTGTEYRVPFNRPSPAGREIDYMCQSLQSGKISGDGGFSEKCCSLLERELGIEKVLLTTSCTHALEMAAFLLDIDEGDEVIIPSFTFVSTANAFAVRKARPRFCDIRPDTLNIDENLIEDMISPRCKALVPVHYGGVGCEMDPIGRLAQSRGIAVIEDNAHGLFGTYRGRALGTFGSLSTVSFHETKNFFCGEGGALMINEPRLIERAEIIREKGTDRSRFFRGEVDRYQWVDLGSSYLLSDLLAAHLYAQLEEREKIISRRRAIWTNYADRLGEWAEAREVRLPSIPAHCGQTWHVYYMIMPSFERRRSFMSYMRSHGILCIFHYLPLHLSKMGRRFGGKEGDCPVTEDVSERIVRLPLYYAMTESDQNYVIDRILAFK